MQRRHHDWEACNYAQESQAKSLAKGLLAYEQPEACLSSASPKLCPPAARTHPCKSHGWGQCDLQLFMQ